MTQDSVGLTETSTYNEGVNLQVWGIRTGVLLVLHRVVGETGVELLATVRNWFAHVENIGSEHEYLGFT